MSATSIYRNFYVIGLSLILCTCGYSLRGDDILSSKFGSVLLNSQQENSEFSRLLRRSLEIADVIIVPTTDSANDEQLALNIGNEEVISRPISVNPRARAAQYELRLSVEISLRNASEQIISPEILSVERSYFEDIENITGNQEEIEIILSEMRKDLVNQLMRRLAAV